MSSAQLTFRDALPLQEAPVPEEPPLAQRLHDCSRLLELAAQELTALGNGDIVKRRELADLRQELTQEIAPGGKDGDAHVEDEDEDSKPAAEELRLLLPGEVARLLTEALHALEERDEEERRMQDRWSSIEEDALKAMHVGGRIVSLRAGRYPQQAPADARLDLRF